MLEVEPFHAQCFKLVAEFFKQRGETRAERTQAGRTRCVRPQLAQAIVLDSDVGVFVALLAEQRFRFLTIAHPVGAARACGFGCGGKAGSRVAERRVHLGAQCRCAGELRQSHRRRVDAGRESHNFFAQCGAPRCLPRALLKHLQFDAQSGQWRELGEHTSHSRRDLLRFIHGQLRALHVALGRFHQCFAADDSGLQLHVART